MRSRWPDPAGEEAGAVLGPLSRSPRPPSAAPAGAGALPAHELDHGGEAASIRRSVTCGCIVAVPIDELDAALRGFPGRNRILRHIRSVGFFGRRVAVDLRFGPIRQEYRAVVEAIRSDRLEWRGAASHGVLRWEATTGSRSRLTVHLTWEPDSVVGLVLSTARLDRGLIHAELRRFGRDLEGRVGGDRGARGRGVPDHPRG